MGSNICSSISGLYIVLHYWFLVVLFSGFLCIHIMGWHGVLCYGFLNRKDPCNFSDHGSQFHLPEWPIG